MIPTTLFDPLWATVGARIHLYLLLVSWKNTWPARSVLHRHTFAESILISIKSGRASQVIVGLPTFIIRLEPEVGAFQGQLNSEFQLEDLKQHKMLSLVKVCLCSLYFCKSIACYNLPTDELFKAWRTGEDIQQVGMQPLALFACGSFTRPCSCSPACWCVCLSCFPHSNGWVQETKNVKEIWFWISCDHCLTAPNY